MSAKYSYQQIISQNIFGVGELPVLLNYPSQQLFRVGKLLLLENFRNKQIIYWSWRIIKKLAYVSLPQIK